MEAVAGAAMLHMPRKWLSSPSRDGRESVVAAPRWGLARHGKARLAPTADLLEDVVRMPCTTSLRARSWRCHLAPLPFQ
jgi:hypothetical protein